MYPNEDFNGKADYIEKWITDLCKEEPRDELYPMAFLITKNPSGDKKYGEVPVLLPDMPPEYDERRRLIGFLAKALYERMPEAEPFAIFVMSEVWYTQAKKDDVLDNLPRPSESPDRKEALAISGLAYDGRACLAILPIIRNPDNTIVLDTENATRNRAGDENSSLEVNILSEFFTAYAVAEAFSKTKN